ncbi:MAG: 3-oxoacyl-[acyl-carrier-protein] synthase, KASIII [Candidatus Carbobacillus altaicus]|uniref:3-oxoacyl-[acyl-carrier-protein] synthase, KASIII n=1 Tax=Candidatus Carbonibacillus altaicus TaxID=2163959 RepID=A0A2R6Y1V3_9BACL|nr:MAG: 3-oxoacyl-[acyl-carrier-protein] synthase, KASIII [Candidatus Carbobacillus altaicus]
MLAPEVDVGILGLGTYIPERVMTSAELSALTGIPEAIVVNKLGIRQKHVPGPDDHTAQMAVWAAERALAAGRIPPESLDVVIYFGEEHKEYPLWTAGIYVQQAIGARNAFAFDIQQRCGTGVLALKLAQDMLRADPKLKTVLLAGGYRNVDLIDYTNPRTRFMFNLGAGGGAIVLQKGYRENILGASRIITDGRFSLDVYVPYGGTKAPLSPEDVAEGRYRLDVRDPESMRERLEAVTMHNFVTVVREALAQSGYMPQDVAYVALLHMKRSAHEAVLRELGIPPERSIYLEDYGHIGQIDQILSLELAFRRGLLRDGDVVVLVSAGIGYAWGATVVRWGRAF